MTTTAQNALAILIAKRPAYVEPILLAGRLGLTLHTVRDACRELKRAGLVEHQDERAAFSDLRPTRSYRAMPHATHSEPVAARGRPARSDTAARVLAAVCASPGGISLREVMAATGLGETVVSRGLKAALDSGAVTRVEGPRPVGGGQRAWVWRAA